MKETMKQHLHAAKRKTIQSWTAANTMVGRP